METYAEDDVVRGVSGVLGMKGYALMRNEAMEVNFGIIELVHNFFIYLRFRFKQKVNPTFAIARMSEPTKIIRLNENCFVILISENMVYEIFNLSINTYTLSPLAEYIAVKPSTVKASYPNETLIDITRRFIRINFDHQEREISVPSSALFFMIAHEYAHFAHGHLDFICSEEFKKSYPPGFELFKTSRALEMDADASAATTVFSYFSEQVFPDIAEHYKGPLDPMHVSIAYFRRYVLGMIISLIYTESITDNYFPKTHLFAYARYLTLANVIERALLHRNPDSKGTVDELRVKIGELFIKLSGSIDTVGHPMVANTRITEGDITTHCYTELGVAEAFVAVDETLERWAKLLPDLRKYLRAGGLAPASRLPS